MKWLRRKRAENMTNCIHTESATKLDWKRKWYQRVSLFEWLGLVTRCFHCRGTEARRHVSSKSHDCQSLHSISSWLRLHNPRAFLFFIDILWAAEESAVQPNWKESQRKAMDVQNASFFQVFFSASECVTQWFGATEVKLRSKNL